MLSQATFDAANAPPLPELSVGRLLDNQHQLCADREAVVSLWQRKRMTYKEIYDSCRIVALRLLACGVRPGDHVAVLAGNSIEYLQLFLAVGAIGAIFSIINPTFTTEEVVTSVEFLEPRAVFVAGRIGYRKNDEVLSSLIRLRDDALLVVELAKMEGNTVDGPVTWDAFLARPVDHQHYALLEKYWGVSQPDDSLCVQFTSGTTGPRKAAMLSHRNLLGNAWAVGHRLRFIQEDRICCCAPLFHCFALVCGIIGPMLYGSTLIIPSDVFLAGATLEALSQESCTVILAVATMLQAMLDHPEAAARAESVCLRTGIVAGSTLSRTMLSRLANEFSFTKLAYGYGMTEASCMVFLTDPFEENLLDDHVSVGRLLPHSSARVLDENLNILHTSTGGELVVSGYLVFKGYYKNALKTKETLHTDVHGREWLRTGDLVQIDDSGRCVITGRVKDMIKRGGENIFPSDIEKVLEQHPAIEAAACVGIPDEGWGEIVGAFVKRTPVTSTIAVGSRELKLWLRKRIAPHKIPEHFFWLGDGAGVPDQFPSNHTGKLLKAELRDIARKLLRSTG